MLQQMNECWPDLLQSYGRHVPPEKITWCTTEADANPAQVNHKGVALTRAPRAKGFKALGVQITFDARYSCEVRLRIQKAWATFFANRDMLCDRRAPLRKRVRFLNSVVLPTLLWCANSWHIPKWDIDSLDVLQRAMSQKMVGLRPWAGEPIDESCVKSSFFARGAPCISPGLHVGVPCRPHGAP